MIFITHFIAHRGNIHGSDPSKENRADYLFEALNQGFEIEIDLWYEDKQWWLGHDKPRYKTGTTIFKNAWCHAKNKEALQRLSNMKGINYFWHNKDDYTITSKGFIWCHSKKPILPNSICVLPEWGYVGDMTKCTGICSDTIDYWKEKYRVPDL
jgi:hypothetical protein